MKAEQHTLILLALRHVLEGEDALISKVVAYTKELSETNFRVAQLSSFVQKMKVGGSPVLVPAAAVGFGDLASWIAVEEFSGQFHAAENWDPAPLKNAAWLKEKLQESVCWCSACF
jgi:hypothetical protein